MDHIYLCNGRKVTVGETIKDVIRGYITLMSIDQDTKTEVHTCGCGTASPHHPQGEAGDYWGYWDGELDGGFLNGSRIYIG